jgi:hypothetical protein
VVKNKALIVVLVLWIILGVIIAVAAGRNRLPEIGLNEPVGGGLFVDYVKDYKNLSELGADADIIVVGRIVRTLEAGTDNATGSLPSTKSVLDVTNVLKGKPAPGIIVNQEGMIGKVEDVASPVFRPGERCVLFLRVSNDGKLYYLIGPWGRYRIVGSKVYSMNYVVRNNGYYEATPGLDFNGVLLNTFTRNITQAVQPSKR